ncbi:MAG: hypothetical protein ABL871_08330, partial [Terricaulis sp.]
MKKLVVLTGKWCEVPQSAARVSFPSKAEIRGDVRAHRRARGRRRSPRLFIRTSGMSFDDDFGGDDDNNKKKEKRGGRGRERDNATPEFGGGDTGGGSSFGGGDRFGG